jgi:hypothetical protein
MATYTYVMTDGAGSAEATVSVNVIPNPADGPPLVTLTNGQPIGNQQLVEGTMINIPFTVTNEFAGPQNLVQSLTWSGPEINCQILGAGFNRTLQITGNMPRSGIPVKLTYTNIDLASTTVNFTVTVTANTNLPTLGTPNYTNSTFTYNISGVSNSTWTVFSSTDLKNWTPVDSLTLDGTGAGSFTDDSINGLMHKFYKLSNGTYTSHAIGFERLSIAPGSTLIADQLVAPQNTLDGLFNIGTGHGMADGTTLPSGTVISFWNGAGYNDYTWNGSAWSANGNAVLAPGGGAFIRNYSGTAFTVTFVGLVADGEIDIPLANEQNSVASSPVPQAGGLTSVLGYVPNFGDELLIWSNSMENFVDYQGDEGGIWDDAGGTPTAEPIIDIGESFFIDPNGQQNWIRSYSLSP